MAQQAFLMCLGTAGGDSALSTWKVQAGDGSNLRSY